MLELAEAMNYMRVRVSAIGRSSRKELALREKNVQKHEIGFISSSNFAAENAARPEITGVLRTHCTGC